MGSLQECKLEGFVCRLCSQIDRNVIHIYTDEGLQKKLEQKINVYLKINLTRFDPLPKVICLPCDVKLEQHHRFIQKVIQNQKKIQGERPGMTAELANRPMIPLLEQHLRVRVSPVVREDGSGSNTYNIEAISSSDSDSDNGGEPTSQTTRRSEEDSHQLNTSNEILDTDSSSSSSTSDQEQSADLDDSAGSSLSLALSSSEENHSEDDHSPPSDSDDL